MAPFSARNRGETLEEEVAEILRFFFCHLSVTCDLQHQAGVADVDLPNLGEAAGSLPGEALDFRFCDSLVKDSCDGHGPAVAAEQHAGSFAVLLPPEVVVGREVTGLALLGGQGKAPLLV